MNVSGPAEQSAMLCALKRVAGQWALGACGRAKGIRGMPDRRAMRPRDNLKLLTHVCVATLQAVSVDPPSRLGRGRPISQAAWQHVARLDARAQACPCQLGLRARRSWQRHPMTQAWLTSDQVRGRWRKRASAMRRGRDMDATWIVLWIVLREDVECCAYGAAYYGPTHVFFGAGHEGINRSGPAVWIGRGRVRTSE